MCINTNKYPNVKQLSWAINYPRAGLTWSVKDLSRPLSDFCKNKPALQSALDKSSHQYLIRLICPKDPHCNPFGPGAVSIWMFQSLHQDQYFSLCGQALFISHIGTRRGQGKKRQNEWLTWFPAHTFCYSTAHFFLVVLLLAFSECNDKTSNLEPNNLW